jgi:hypothetical protein
MAVDFLESLFGFLESLFGTKSQKEPQVCEERAVDSPGLQSVGMVGTCVSLRCLDTFRVHHLTLCGQEAEWCLRADPSHFVVISRTISSGPTPRHTGTPYYQCTTRWLLFFLLLVGCCSIPTMPPARIPRWTKDH